MSDSSPCVPVAPSTNTGYTVSFVLLLAVIVEFDANVAVTAFPEHAADVPELVIYPAPLVIALLFSDMFADPSKATPAIVFVAASLVAVAALPEQAADVPELVIYPAPLVIALLFSDMFAVPSNDTPAIVLAFAKAVAVAALPVHDPDEPDVLPVTLPVRAPVKLVATRVPDTVPPVEDVSIFFVPSW